VDGRHDLRADARASHATYDEARSSELQANQPLIAEIRRHELRNAAQLVSAVGVLADRRHVDHMPIATGTGPEPAQFWCSHPMTGRR
jgi:hypothetical protein